MKSTYAPRLLWRRLLATIIDVTFVALAFAALLMEIQPIFPGKIVFDAPIGVEYCSELNETPKLEAFAKRLDPTLELPRTFKLCKESFFGQLEYQKLSVRVITAESDQTQYSLGLTVFVDDELNEFVPFDFETIFFVSLPVLFALCYFAFGTTPGKKVVGLHLEGSEPRPPFTKILKRELLRFAPILIWSVIQLAFLLSLVFISLEEMLEFTLRLSMNPVYWLAFISLCLFCLLYYLVPLMRWRGQMHYDRWSNFEGVRRA